MSSTRHPTFVRSIALAVLVALGFLWAGCGGGPEAPSSPKPAATPAGTGPAGGAPVGTTAAPAPPPPLPEAPPRPARIGARSGPLVEKCIEERVRDRGNDALGPRDPRRKLRRLQLKAECEEQLASR